MRNEKGFTLMELMIVIVIIGVLAAIGIPAYNGYVNKAKEAACKANKRTIETAAGLYWAETGLAIAEDKITTSADCVLKGYLTNVGEILCPLDTAAEKAGYGFGIDDAGKVTVTCKAGHN